MLKSPWRSERLVISVARKKIVLVIVEGPSDDAALGVILNRLFDKNTVHVERNQGIIPNACGDCVRRLCFGRDAVVGEARIPLL